MPEKATVTSAIYVDFDNVYSALREQYSEISNLFYKRAEAWLRSLEEGEDGGPRRDFLIKNCYMNLDYARPMHAGGFETIQCPSQTRQGKSGADIRMAVDIVVESTPNSGRASIEEFIILSNDSDFTPVAAALRRNNKRVTILELGAISSAYRNMANRTITNLPEMLQRLVEQGEPPAFGVPSNAEVPSTTTELDTQARSDCAALIKGCVSNNVHGRVELNELESELKGYFEGLEAALPWSDRQTFKTFLGSLALQPLTILDGEVVSTVPGGVVKDMPSPPESFDPEVYEFAQRVHEMTGTPLLSPKDYAELFTGLTQELNEHGAPAELRDLAQQVSLPATVTPRNAEFVLRGLHLAGYRFQPGHETPQKLARTFAESVLYRCRERANFYPTDDDLAILKRWLGERPQETMTPRHTARQLEDERSRCIRLVKQAVTGRKDGMELSELGSLLQERLPGLYRPSSAQGKWGGLPTLTKMLLSFDVKPLSIVPIDEKLSIIYDPNAQCEEEAQEAVVRLLRRVAAPSLSPSLYGRFFSALDRLVRYYDRIPGTESLVESLYAEQRDQDIGRESIRYILETLEKSGYRFQKDRGSAASIARYYAAQVLKHCRLMLSSDLSRRDLVQTYHWLTMGSFAPHSTEPRQAVAESSYYPA